MRFDEAQDYLYSLGNEVSAMKLGLESIGKVLAALGGPHDRYKKVQIAGTNGKGSVCAFLDSMCRTAGIRTGLFTSPHLVSITERIKINGEDISETQFAELATLVRETCENLVRTGELESVPTYFEQVTAIGLKAFEDACVELVVLETGLGGRFDATTAAGAEIAGITQIALDHQNILGNTLTEIAAEKAAIIHSGTIAAVAAHQDAAVEQLITDRCRELGVHFEWSTMETAIAEEADDSPVLRASFLSGRHNYDGVRLKHMLGRHQVENAAVAIGLAEAISEHWFPISKQDVISGLENARNPGRLELTNGILLDGAHNQAGAEALRTFVEENIRGPIVMIFGTMRDKDIGDIAEILFPLADHLILTRPENSRAMTANEVLRFVPDGIAHERITLSDTPADALSAAFELAERGESLILVTGSLYLIGDVKRLLNTIPETKVTIKQNFLNTFRAGRDV